MCWGKNEPEIVIARTVVQKQGYFVIKKNNNSDIKF